MRVPGAKNVGGVREGIDKEEALGADDAAGGVWPSNGKERGEGNATRPGEQAG